MDAFLAMLGIKKGVFFSGLFGAAISYKFCSEKPRKEILFNILFAIPLAWYCGPFVAEWAKVTSDQGQIGVVCLTGALGIAILSKFVEVLPEFIELGKDFFRKKA